MRLARLSRGTRPARGSEDLPEPDDPKSVISLASPCARRASQALRNMVARKLVAPLLDPSLTEILAVEVEKIEGDE